MKKLAIAFACSTCCEPMMIEFAMADENGKIWLIGDCPTCHEQIRFSILRVVNDLAGEPTKTREVIH